MMGYGANFTEVIEEKNIRKFCPKEFKNLETAIANSDTTWDEVAQALCFSNEDELAPNVLIYYRQLRKALEKKTGLEIRIGYHDSSEQGDRYDEVDGKFWEVEGMYQLSSAGKKMKKYVDRRFYVTFG